MVLRTGEMFYSSASGLAIMTATVLSQDNSPPEIAHEFKQFLWQWHGLVKICQKIVKGLLRHNISSLYYSHNWNYLLTLIQPEGV